MKEMNFWGFMVACSMMKAERKKQAGQHQESKKAAQQMHKRNVAKGLGQHNYVYLSHRSR
ncbi:MAG: hypothetical protein ACI4OR_03550 [Alphaproteobacteria bacterium]